MNIKLPSRPGQVPRPGASTSDIEVAQALLGIIFPVDYVAFLTQSDGAVGVLGRHYLSLWPLAEVTSAQKDAAVDEFVPGLILFGSDGGDATYAFMKQEGTISVVEVSLEGLGEDPPRHRANSFTEFLEAWSAAP